MKVRLRSLIGLLVISLTGSTIVSQQPKNRSVNQPPSDGPSQNHKGTSDLSSDKISRIEPPIPRSTATADRQTQLTEKFSPEWDTQAGIVSACAQPQFPLMTFRTSHAASLLPPTIAPAVYKPGVGDVLDIRLLNHPTKHSTLYTIQGNGTLEHPLLNGPLVVVGLTTDEIAALLSREIKVIQSPQVNVTVRDYVSHVVNVTGYVESPGAKFLNKEAMPLYAVLSNAVVRREARTASIVRAGKEFATINLKDEQALTMLVQHGDVVQISGAEPEAKFFYVTGAVNSPGERYFREGMTLTQGLMAAGGASQIEKPIVKVLRRDEGGFLHAHQYDLLSITNGKSPDPLLMPGDRIAVAGPNYMARQGKKSREP